MFIESYIILGGNAILTLSPMESFENRPKYEDVGSNVTGGYSYSSNTFEQMLKQISEEISGGAEFIESVSIENDHSTDDIPDIPLENPLILGGHSYGYMEDFNQDNSNDIYNDHNPTIGGYDSDESEEMISALELYDNVEITGDMYEGQHEDSTDDNTNGAFDDSDYEYRFGADEFYEDGEYLHVEMSGGDDNDNDEISAKLIDSDSYELVNVDETTQGGFNLNSFVVDNYASGQASNNSGETHGGFSIFDYCE